MDRVRRHICDFGDGSQCLADWLADAWYEGGDTTHNLGGGGVDFEAEFGNLRASCLDKVPNLFSSW